MSWYFIVFLFLILLGALTLSYQIFKLISLDAESRGLKHPGFWGLFSLSGNGSGGLLLYLIGRRKYPSVLSVTAKEEMVSRKKKAGVSLVFLAVGAVCMVIAASFTM